MESNNYKDKLFELWNPRSSLLPNIRWQDLNQQQSKFTNYDTK